MFQRLLFWTTLVIVGGSLWMSYQHVEQGSRASAVTLSQIEETQTPEESVAENPEVARKLTDQDFRKHVEKLQKTLPDDSYSIVVEKPFVVIGNQSPEVTTRWAQQTVRWALTRLKKQYFAKDPDHIIDIWLLKDEASYNKQCERIVGYHPTTPYGFYSAHHNVLMMNISTGGGTLVHEIVHPLMESNFAACPSWFNEGLASLYEQSTSGQEGQILGLTNWRLRHLQLAIRSDQVPSFKTLCGTTTRQFYHQDPGTNYAQARYLCYYLQQQGKLESYFHKFRENVAEDPSGYKTLQQVLDRDDMTEFQEDWQKFVLRLRFQ